MSGSSILPRSGAVCPARSGLARLPNGVTAEGSSGLALLPKGVGAEDSSGLALLPKGVAAEESSGLARRPKGVAADPMSGLARRPNRVPAFATSGLARRPKGVAAEPMSGLARRPNCATSTRSPRRANGIAGAVDMSEKPRLKALVVEGKSGFAPPRRRASAIPAARAPAATTSSAIHGDLSATAARDTHSHTSSEETSSSLLVATRLHLGCPDSLEHQPFCPRTMSYPMQMLARARKNAACEL
mmetsp:Transcript_26124/g.73321  ORF Transcript_26124/g.73321 Transcript_26124/m.73321 type:complete len:244 (-) Transcript_26124:120-851(-)